MEVYILIYKGFAQFESIIPSYIASATGKVYTVPKYDDVSVAARVMRNHKIHRVIVTHEQEVVGVLSAFDLLELVEGHRWIAKNPPSESRRKKSKRT